MPLIALALLLAAAAQRPADVVFTGGGVYTVDAVRSWAQAVAVRDGRIAYVGNDVGARAFVGPKTRLVSLAGRLLLPAFQDAHVHPISGGIELGQCNINDLPTKDAILDKVRACAKRGEAWIVGGGWVQPAFPDSNPTKDLLDAIATDRPIVMSSADGHSEWLNSKALELAGITAATPDPADGRIERDPSGAPSGTLREAAQDLIENLMPKPTAETRLEGLRQATELLNGFGITAVYEANAGGGPKGAGLDTLRTYREAERLGLLKLRVRAALGTDASRGPEQVDDLIAARKEFTSARLKPTSAKIFADGVIESRTAAMLEPYLDRPSSRGEPAFSDEALKALVARLVSADFAVHVHAIGDRAIRMTLDAFEASRKQSADRGLRHQIAHLQIIEPEDVPRFRELGVIANFEPLWAFADSYVRDLTWPAIGPERSKRMYPIAELARSGAVLSFGSDWSVSSPNPLEGIQVALTREALDPKERVLPMLPEQAIDLPTALAAYTIGAAYANGIESETGSVEVGKAADLVVLSEDLFRLDPHEIAKARVLLTLLEGQPVYRDASLAW
jgi:predicted amidohydrolase YtcJ